MFTIYRVPGASYDFVINRDDVKSVVVGDISGYYVDFAPVSFDVDSNTTYKSLA